MRFAELDAVTLDAYGTLLTLRDPVPALRRALAERGVERAPADVDRAFRLEVEYYAQHALSAADADSLAALRRACAAVFLEAAGAELDADSFAAAFVEALVFELAPGALETTEMLASRGLSVAIVADWDVSLRDQLRRLELDRRVDSVVISAEVGARKPDPRLFQIALEELRVAPERALHVGDDAKDEEGARAAGMQFAWAPLVDAFDGWH
jgi:putative hydrolase of the HAD superfamily